MQEEIYNTRGMEYSAWHRRFSTKRFVGLEKAQLLAMIDVDALFYTEYDDATKMPLAIVEVAKYTGHTAKPSTVTKNLAKMANIAGFVALYKLSHEQNPADTRYRDIDYFWIKQLHPTEEFEWTKMTPEEWCKKILEFREKKSNHLMKLLDSK